MYCDNCGQELRDTARFCGFCGAPVEAAATVSEASRQPVDAAGAGVQRGGLGRKLPKAVLILLAIMAVTGVALAAVLVWTYVIRPALAEREQTELVEQAAPEAGTEEAAEEDVAPVEEGTAEEAAPVPVTYSFAYEGEEADADGFTARSYPVFAATADSPGLDKINAAIRASIAEADEREAEMTSAGAGYRAIYLCRVLEFTEERVVLLEEQGDLSGGGQYGSDSVRAFDTRTGEELPIECDADLEGQILDGAAQYVASGSNPLIVEASAWGDGNNMPLVAADRAYVCFNVADRYCRAYCIGTVGADGRFVYSPPENGSAIGDDTDPVPHEIQLDEG